MAEFKNIFREPLCCGSHYLNTLGQESGLDLYLAIGAGIGVALWAAWGNIPMGIHIGAGAGIAIWAAIRKKKNQE